MSHNKLLTMMFFIAISATSGFIVCPNDRQSRSASVLFAGDDTTETQVEISPTEDKDSESQVAGEVTVKAAVRCPDCDLCDGSGRILGGIGTVLEWWPIKAYRPCPNFVERGGKYVRSGQGLDEIAFGRIQND